MKLSKQDLKILELLQIDVKTSVEHLSEEVGLSTASIQRHLKRLRDNKVIAQEVAIISPNAVNQSMQAAQQRGEQLSLPSVRLKKILRQSHVQIGEHQSKMVLLFCVCQMPFSGILPGDA